METKHSSIIDELRRVLLPSQICEQLGWTSGRKVTAQIIQQNQSVKSFSIHASEDGDMVIDDLSRVELTEDVCNKLDLAVGKLSISLSTDGLYVMLEQKGL